MRYRDITQTNRFRLPAPHPILAEIVIDQENWYDLQRLNADNKDTHIVGHDPPRCGKIAVFIACASEDVRDRLEGGWG
jgi:hypothetical protein